ncbi:hypothetical protein TrST_g11070 [Triparma strigata]|uniref:Alpha-L-glutamate ligase-related protein ATP-grasp domain-containing protein n=1 Tax=Triparma strigata TaxID=1606541 RepID=A0A9W7B187_9STRA|nr:hypothetical protein TrST_g11070 [Triparma strigata]
MVSRSRSPSRSRSRSSQSKPPPPSSSLNLSPKTSPPPLPSAPLALYYYLTILLRLLLSPSISLSTLLNSSYPLSDITLTYIYQLTIPLKHWSKPHYRKGTYQQDLKDNLVNVAVPGTGVPLSYFVFCKVFYGGFILVVVPFILFIQEIHLKLLSKPSSFTLNLLGYDLDWCSLWRINCNLTHLHALKTRDVGYEMENKWSFILKSESLSIPISPCLPYPGLCIKHKNEEGGLGINFFKNARDGGEWIIQKVIRNSDFVSEMLPPKSPLSTFRVMTISHACVKKEGEEERKDFEELSVVFRAGREGALTDHDSILFPVSPSTGLILPGTINKNWYSTYSPFTTLRSQDVKLEKHPDTGNKIAGRRIEEIKRIVEICTDAHFKALPRVPIVGWDVVLCSEEDVPGGICLLEVNLSCNFFRGVFDEDKWWRFVKEVIVEMEGRD